MTDNPQRQDELGDQNRGDGGPEGRDGRRGRSSEGRGGRRRSGPQVDPRYAGWEDSLDHVYCLRYRRIGPETYPVQSRHGLAVMQPRAVAHRETEMLICDCQHDGVCQWPDSVEVGRN